jgi:hypothetical protein
MNNTYVALFMQQYIVLADLFGPWVSPCHPNEKTLPAAQVVEIWGLVKFFLNLFKCSIRPGFFFTCSYRRASAWPGANRLDKSQGER